jgi:hypothetical protein
MIAFTCPECGERPVEVICIAGPAYDESKEFWFNPMRGRDCDLERGEFRCEPCAIASGADCVAIDTLAFFPALRRSYENLAERVGLRRWAPKS